MSSSFSASVASGEAVLSFPYDERLRQLLRAIPGRRWDPVERVWRVPLDPDRSEALARLIGGLPGEPCVSDDLARALARDRRRRRRGACVVDLARPDGDWWLSFATDAAPAVVDALLAHPGVRPLPAIARALAPVDERSAEIVAELAKRGEPLTLTPRARRALDEPRGRRGARPVGRIAEPAGDAHRGATGGGQRPGALRWRGTIEVAGPREAPVFVLLGDTARLPVEVRARAASAPGGATMPLTVDCLRLVESHLDGWVEPAAARCIAALRAGLAPPPVALEVSRVHGEATFVLAPGHEPAQLAVFSAISGALPPLSRRGGRHEHARLPGLRADPFCVPELDEFLSEHGAWVASDALELLQDLRERHARAAGLVERSAATDAQLEVPDLGGELKPFQRAGVSYLLDRRRAFLADEQGLGKTIEALAALEADGAFPAVVVCPASLKLNWLREIERWLPARTARALAGRARAAADAGVAHTIEAPTEITVVNYDILAAHLEELCAMRPRALVLDESHYCKNGAARRTQAAQRLARAVRGDGLIAALTGTPVMNRPLELVAQLRILGRLEDFGSGAQFGRRFRGPDAHVRLHWHLRSRCFVRRLKADVLPQLPAKTRSVVPIELDNEAEYRLAEHDVVAWLQSQPLDLRELDAKVAAALRAERLVRLNALKLLAARGKLRAALAWIHDFHRSGEHLVVFARHREIQRAILERFPRALHVLGDDRPVARDAALRAFQDEGGGEGRLIVCSMEVAGQGITLTRASNVAFLELDWTPAKHDQAEDRCHRIGQQDAVNVTYLLAADTIDETIAMLLDRKRAVIGAVTDGQVSQDEAVLDALVRELRGAPYRHLRLAA